MGLAPAGPAQAVEAAAQAAPEREAIRFQGRRLSYGALADQVRRAAWALGRELGLRRGDRIAYYGLNSPEGLVLLFAAARLGLVLVPLNWRLTVPELGFVLRKAGVRWLFAEERFRANAERLPCEGTIATNLRSNEEASLHRLIAAAPDGAPAEAKDLADAPLLLVFTSGTTGRPKGAVLSQRAVMANAANSLHMHGMTAADRALTVLPTFHVGGLNIQTVPALSVGASVLLHPRFDPAATLGAIARDRPTLTVLVPTVMQALLGHPDWAGTDLSSLRAVSAGSTDVPVALIERFHARGVPVIQVYGATETGPIAIYQRAHEALATCGSIGRAGQASQVRLCDEDGREVPDGIPGEILVKGENVAREYWDEPEASAAAFADGWFRSGDIAARDGDGLYWFKDRARNVIISGGENIYPAEIERVLAEAPGVAEAAVVGRPDDRWGAVPVAVIAPSAAGAADRDAIAAQLDGALARYKHPKDLIFVEALPRNSMGKVVVEEVRAIARAALKG